MRTLRRELEDRLREIRARLGNLEDGIDATARGRDLGDQAAATHNHEVTADERERLTETAQEIRRALGRMDARTYGKCADCNGLIGPSRLQAIPYAETCIECERIREAMALADEREAGIRRVPRPTRGLEP